MSTGLTFGTISSLYGLQARIIDETQFSLLVTVVVLSAIVPTAIAQRWFSPDIAAEKEADMAKPKAPRAARAPKPIPAEAGVTPYVFDNVLVGIDGFEGVQRALDCALSLVERLGGRLTAVPVEGKPPAYAATIGEVDEVKQAHGHDLIVIGHTGHFLSDYLLGSTADRVAHHAHCPVIVVPLVGC